MKSLRFILFLFVVGMAVACSKQEMRSKNFEKGEKWRVASVAISGDTTIYDLGNWNVKESDSLYNTKTVAWKRRGQQPSYFHWDFSKDGKQFIISVDPSTAADYFSVLLQNLAGNYKIEKSTTNVIRISSSSTQGISGKNATIEIWRMKY